MIRTHMKIRKINIMRGPNYWSITRHKLIALVLDLQEMDGKLSTEIPGFNSRLEKMFPALARYRRSSKEPKDFFGRAGEGILMSEVIEHIALEMQTLAGMDVSFGRTGYYGEKGVYNVVFAYLEEEVGSYAASAAVRICKSLIKDEKFQLEQDIAKMQEIRSKVRLGPSTLSIINEASSRNIPWIRLNKHSLFQLGYGANQKRIQATITSETSTIAVSLACDKLETKYLLEQAQIPVPQGEILSREEDLLQIVENLGFPLVTKPLNGNHGRGITININTSEEAIAGFKKAKEIAHFVLVEKQVKGKDYRLLVINNKFVAAAQRSPAHIKGDGHRSIRQLVEEVNSDPRRGIGHEQVLTRITIDASTLNILRSQDLTPESILKKGKKIILKDTANLSTGGTSTDVTDIVHPENIFMAERIATIIGLDICGIDIMTRDIKEPLANTGGKILEVNAGPGFRMHLNPASGLPRNVAAPVVDKLFPNNSTGTIPIIAVTGTNGKTTTTRLIAHIAKQEGYKVGYTTSDGVYIQNRLLMKGDCTGPVSAQYVLKDPTVNFAVLECARGGILRAGLGFNNCDIGIVTNVTEDHLGLNGIHSVEQLAKVKAIIPESVDQDGYSILNADDDLVYEMRRRVISKIALFSMDENNPRIKKMQEEGGLTAVYEKGYITICKGEWKLRVTKAINIPLTFGGKAKFMIQNVLPAVLAAHIKGISLNDIEVALQTFIPSPSQTPGRLNMFQFRNFQLLMDYAHNPSGMIALKEFTNEVQATYKVGIITGVGDRKKEDMIEMGKVAAEMFDEVIIRQDKHLRGRSADEIISYLREGIEQHDPTKKTLVIKDEKEAVIYAIENARKGSLIVICSEMIKEVTKLIQEMREEDQEPNYDTNGIQMSPAT